MPLSRVVVLILLKNTCVCKAISVPSYFFDTTSFRSICGLKYILYVGYNVFNATNRARRDFINKKRLSGNRLAHDVVFLRGRDFITKSMCYTSKIFTLFLLLCPNVVLVSTTTHIIGIKNGRLIMTRQDVLVILRTLGGFLRSVVFHILTES